MTHGPRPPVLHSLALFARSALASAWSFGKYGSRALVVVFVVAAACSNGDKQRGGLGGAEEHVQKTSSALTVTRYEGESMSWSGVEGADGQIVTSPPPAFRYFWTDGYDAQSHPFVGGSTTITVRAAGDLMGGVGPHVVVSVGGTAIGSGYFNNDSAFASQTFSFNATAGSQEIRVTFDNDDASSTEDRNLLLDWIEVAEPPPSGGTCSDTSYEGEAMAWSGVEGTDGEIRTDPAPTHRYFWQNSYVTQSHTFAAQPMRIRLHAMGDIVDGVGPHVVVSVGGVDIGSAYINDTSYVDKDFEFTAAAGTQQIRVTYDNDLWRSPGGAGNDRNLLLDKVEVLCGSGTDAGADGGSEGGSSTCTPPDCGDRLPCQTGTCTSGSCTYTAAANGTSCSDSNSCTTSDQCTSGTCSGTPIALTPPPCTTRTCDPATGVHDSSSPAGTACPNGNLCDGNETCDGAGTCQAGSAPPIDDGNPCTTDSCDPATGVHHTLRAAGSDCSTDNNVCNGIETCDSAGVCQPGTPPVLDDGNVCTFDACSATTGVTHTPVPNCDPTPVQGDAPFETRASILGRTVANTGAPISGVTFTVYDERATGAPRSDVVATAGGDGSFKLALTAFPNAEPGRTPPHRLIVVIDSPGTIRAYREGYAHVGTTLDLGDIRLVARDPAITNIGPAGGTASDSQGLVEVVIPAGALATTLPIQITPFQQRTDFPAPLPESTLTMYGFELEPSGTTFATPITLRVANYRNLPTTMTIPAGSYDPVENRWEHEGIASWDGSRFAVPITHFSSWDLNKGALSDLVLKIDRGPDPNQDEPSCGKGSSWRVGGGGIEPVVVLPGMHVRGEDLSLSLHYASGLAASRKLGAAPTPTGSAPAVSRGSLAVSIPSVKVTAMCVAAGGGGGGTTPGTCSVAVGKCGLNGGGASSIRGRIGILASELAQTRALAAQAQDADFGGWVDMPLAGPDQIAEPGLVTQRVAVSSDAISACAAGGGIFGVPDPLSSGVQLPGVESGALMTASRRVLVNHRFSSPFGAGWAIREVSRVYVDGDLADLVSGEGQVEEFRPRATVTATPVGLGEMALGRDLHTGEVFAAIEPGRIARLDPTTGAPTDVITGAAFTSGDFPRLEGLAVAYVAGARHFVVATDVALLDIDAGGARRVLAPRTGRPGLFRQASVAALDDLVFYTDGDDTKPVVYRLSLSDATPTLQPLSALTGDVRLQPRAAMSGVQFGGPRGLAISQDGSLLIADFRRHAVYAVDPSAAGTIDGNSHVRIVLGEGAGKYVPAAGERQPALAYSLNQPAALAVAEDGTVLVLSSYGITSFDPVAREAELLFLDGGRDEIFADLGSPANTASFVAVTGTSLLARAVDQSTTATVVRINVERLASTRSPTRVLRKLAGIGAGFELTDTTAASVWRFDTDGRMVEQRKRTGELDFGVEYAVPHSSRISRIVDSVGGGHVFAYSGTKIASITDPAGRVTQLNVDAQGDLTSIVEPDGEIHAFVYDSHRMLTKTSPRGDVTAYTYGPDGTVATSTKPGGETYSFEPAFAGTPSYNTAGASVRTGAYTDFRGVRHAFTTDIFGAIDSETYTADGVTRTVTAVHPDVLFPPDGSLLSPVKNAFRRTSNRTVNGVALSPAVLFDTFGRPARQAGVVAAGDIHRWDYAPDGWLVESFSGPSNTAQRIERDAAGHVLRVFDARPESGGIASSGREIRFTWRADGQPSTMTEHGVTTTFTYDDLGSHNLLSASDTLGRTTTLGYDAFGNVTSTTDGTASASFVFDVANRLRTSRDGVGNETTFRYENIDCGCTEQDEVTGVHTPDLPAGVEWAMTYGAQGRLASVTDPQGFTESYTYEPTGEVKTVTDRLGRTTSMAHDQLGRLLTLVDTLGRSHGRSYSVPASGGWQGPTLTAGSGDTTAAATGLATSLRDGDYQIGVNALQANGFPAQISLYRDATFALGFSHDFDNAQRPTHRLDRSDVAIDSTTLPNFSTAGSFWDSQRGYDLRTSAPVTNIVFSAGSSTMASSTSTADWAPVEFDMLSTTGFGTGVVLPATYVYSRDAGGRVTVQSNALTLGGGLNTFNSVYTYNPDGRLSSNSNADGGQSSTSISASDGSIISTGAAAAKHDYTYDARGLLATQTDFDGTYVYTYDELGRSKRLEFPDGHARVQVYDDLGRIVSRCYEYADPALTRCYGATYDPVGNPLQLTDPEGSDLYEYDALDRLTKVTRLDLNGLTVSVEDYAFNSLGALSKNAGIAVDHRRPRLDGAGVADAAVPATVDGLPVGLDAGGRVTALGDMALAWDKAGELRHVDLPVPKSPVDFAFDSFGRRVWTDGAPTIGRIVGSTNVPGAQELYLYEGVHRVAAVAPSAGTHGVVLMSFLYDGVDHPLRLSSPKIEDAQVPVSPLPPEQLITTATALTVAYYELDLAGNVRRLRQPGGLDLGGYRYSAFGETLEDTVILQTVDPKIQADNRTQPLRWKGMWRYDFGGGVELYDARARMWSPKLGTFLSIDEFAFHDARSTLWGWPNQNPVTFSDPSGREGLQGALVGAEIGAFAGAAIYVATAPTLTWGGLGTAALEGGIVGGAFGSGNWSAGILAVGALGVASDKDLYKFGLAGGPGEGASCPVKSGPSRLPQDVGVNPTAPRPLGLNRPISNSAAQNAQLARDIADAKAAGAGDFRVNQQQVNAAGERVGTNRPDLQYTDASGQRQYVEYDTPTSGRGQGHRDRILANDPNGNVVLKIIP